VRFIAGCFTSQNEDAGPKIIARLAEPIGRYAAGEKERVSRGRGQRIAPRAKNPP